MISVNSPCSSIESFLYLLATMSCLVLNGSLLIGFEVVIWNNSIHSPAKVSAEIMVPSLIFVALQHSLPEVPGILGLGFIWIVGAKAVLSDIFLHLFGEFSHCGLP